MELFGVVKRTKVLPEAAAKQFEVLLPEEHKQGYVDALEKCKDSVKGIKDLCEVGFTITKCFHEQIQVFFFP